LRRLSPRPLGRALEGVTREAAPAGILASVQGCWREVAGPVLAAESEPVAERDGVVTMACRSSVWAQELELLATDLRDRLNAAMQGSGSASRVRALRFVVASSPRR
jgi:predicted nucleic acid-binding Zn ribbon protein